MRIFVSLNGLAKTDAADYWLPAKLAFLVTFSLLSVSLTGCNVDTPADVQRALQQATKPADDESTNGDASHPADEATTQPVSRTTWDAIYLKGNKVGYIRTSTTDWTDPASGHHGVRLEADWVTKVMRLGMPVDQKIHVTSYEVPLGTMKRFVVEQGEGQASAITSGDVEDGKLQLIIKARDKKAQKEHHTAIDWPAGTGGIDALQQSLVAHPLEPNEKRQFNSFQIIFNEIATTSLTAHDYQPTKLRERSEELLQIDCLTKLANQPDMPMTLWTNRAGEIIKSQNPMLDTESYRVTKSEAMTSSGPQDYDIVRDLSVKLDKPLGDVHAAKQMRYRTELKTSDPKNVFVDDLSQQVKILDQHTAELNVRAIRPGQPAAVDAGVQSTPKPGDREPNDLVQSDDPLVMKMAKAAAGDEQDSWKLACKLEKFVHDVIRDKDFGRGDLASAAEIAADPHGDCRAHAVLLTGLARANNIPSRAALGLVYVPRDNSFGFHMWTEMWIENRWIPMDATLGRGGIGAGHIKLKTTNLAGIAPISAFLPVAQAAGQLKIIPIEEK